MFTLRYASWNENVARLDNTLTVALEHFRVACTVEPSAGIFFNSSSF